MNVQPFDARARSNFTIDIVMLGLVFGLAFTASNALAAGTWSAASGANPNGPNGTMMLLTDGTVMITQATASGASKVWSKLTPDSTGGYSLGKWSTLTSMSLERLYTASNVMTNGKVFILGGEYSGPATTNNWINSGEIYDPVTDKWSSIPNFPKSQFGDDPTILLPNGKILAGYLSGSQTYLYNPTTNSWTTAGTKLRGDSSDEETWVMLPDGSVLSYDIFSSAAAAAAPYFAQRYIPGSNTWVDAGQVPVLLSTSTQGYELGPALLLPNGKVFQVGGNELTALFDIATTTWTAGPTMTSGMGADDAPGAILPNGHVLFCADTVLFKAPTRIYDYDYTTNTMTDVTPTLPSALALELAAASAFECRMLVLPNGHLLFNAGGSQLWEYTPAGAPNASWAPTITSIALLTGKSYRLTGTRLTGISEGACYGDDAGMSTNYPIVQLKQGSTVRYARTTNWTPGVSSPGASTPMTTDFLLPSAPAGTYQLSVIANGIASAATPFVVPPAPNNYVAASYNPVSQTLTLTGDLDDNAITLTIKNTTITVTGGGSTRIGTAASSSPTFTFHYGGNLTINASMQNGADQVIVNGLQATAANFDLGSGDDILKISYCKFTTTLVDGGLGFDSVSRVAVTGSYVHYNVELLLP